VTLQPGNLIFTGTPAHFGRLEPSDVVTRGIEGLDEFEFTIAPALP
jgi:fumarylpyruvate hydrolase